MKKFEQDYEISTSATEALTYWILYAQVPMKGEEGRHHRIRYVSGPEQDGNVLILRDTFISDDYIVESWGPMGKIDDFVRKGLAQILAEKVAGESGTCCF